MNTGSPPPPRAPEAEVHSLYTDAAYYRMMFGQRSHDLPFYTELPRPGDAVLELGIGTGRVALPLARAGIEVVGVDASAPMLELLAQQVAQQPAAVRARIRWHQADVRQLRLSRRFSWVLYPFNGLAHHHSDAELAQLFATIDHHLAPAGCFAFDVTVPDPQVLAGQSSSAPWFRHPATGEVCRCDETTSYDPVRRVLTCSASIRFLLADRAEVLRWELRQWFPYEIPRLLQRHRFQLVRPGLSLVDATAYVAQRVT